MLSKVSDILDKGAELLEVESAVLLQRLLRLGAAIALFLGLIIIGVAGVLCLAAAGILAAQARFGLIASLLGAGLVIFLIAGAGLWLTWQRTRKLFEKGIRTPSIERAKSALRKAMKQKEDDPEETPPAIGDPIVARVVESIIKNPELTAAAGAAFVALLGPTRVLRGLGHAAGLVSGWVAILRMGREAGLFKDGTPKHAPRSADNGRARAEAQEQRPRRMDV